MLAVGRDREWSVLALGKKIQLEEMLRGADLERRTGGHFYGTDGLSTAIEDFTSLAVPNRRLATVFRDPHGWPRAVKRTNPDLIRPILVRSVSQPPAVGRKGSVSFIVGRGEKRSWSPCAFEGHDENVPMAHFDLTIKRQNFPIRRNGSGQLRIGAGSQRLRTSAAIHRDPG